MNDTQAQRKRNLKLGLILASVVLTLFFGIMVRWALLH
ncbi:MAG: cytochrome oxidase small assembly protein [Comamonadaceae bacterium]|nr:cytochrome oxidase small assembly protein [Burkholderiales bacterium]MEB2348709.1 cytochrome oxidase small assembly protein [Comamonadaceae bacterium]